MDKEFQKGVASFTLMLREKIHINAFVCRPFWETRLDALRWPCHLLARRGDVVVGRRRAANQPPSASAHQAKAAHNSEGAFL